MAFPLTFRSARRAFTVRVLPAVCLLPVAVASGCMTPSAPPHGAEVANADVAVQSGKLLLAPHTFRDVYYGIPYAGVADPGRFLRSLESSRRSDSDSNALSRQITRPIPT